ncbi:hypothetical protein SteCoe_7762 [Stentor coeruleus]|uniref:non-specific serine/threonine protein kinase n=1 Tax=Stentor coeruleus TaxID=5963 RepID=A0A1R2CLT4_9CILI|nr:hypothetical protein SteCoe_7762 [Stentor coeruleus]
MGCGKTKVNDAVLKNQHSKAPNQKEEVSDIVIRSNLIRKPTKPFNEEYHNGNKIGTGGFAEVRRCTHKLTGMMRAVKIYYKNLFPQEYLNSGGLQQEIEIFKRLDHPNLVKVYEYFEDDKCFYITMEFCLGGELFHKIGAIDRLTEQVVCDIMRQLFSVVSYIHSQNIAHRDLKPENILIEERGEELHLKIADFGNAVFLTNGVKLKGETGTCYYMAPEVIESEYTEKCDEWSSGVIMYMLLTGNPPFTGETDEQIMESVKTQKYSLDGKEFSKVSDEAKDLIQKLLVPEDQRITALEALSHKWFHISLVRKSPRKDTISSVTNNLRNFRNTFKLKEAIRTFIISQIISVKDTKPIREVFALVDSDGDGRISEDDLFEYLKQNKDVGDARNEAMQIMEKLDSGRAGYIEYSQYLRASIDAGIVLSKNNLTMAFKMLDPEKKGYVSAEELMRALSEDQTESNIEIWKTIIRNASKSKEGMINLDQFIDMLAHKI